MGFYNTQILPRVLDWAMQDKTLIPLRKEVLSSAKGRVVEIGFGAGANLPYYPSAVESIVAIENSEAVLKRAKKRLSTFPGKIETLAVTAAEIPLDAHSVDFVVSTFTLCSIADTAKLLRELKRILKKDGTLLFLEHGLAPERSVQKWQNRLNPIQNKIAGGCNLNRNILGLFADACWDVVSKKNFYLQGSPKVFGYLSQGQACP